MKLQAYLQDTISTIQDNKNDILNHIYYLQCLQKLQAENAPRNIMIRLAWDITRISAAKEIKNKARDEGCHDEHIETLFTTAIKQSGIIDNLKDLDEDTKNKIMLDAKSSAESSRQHRIELEEQETNKRRVEQEKANRELQEEIKRRVAARSLYRGYGSQMNDKQFDKFHEIIDKKIVYDSKLITIREYIEKLIYEFSGYPVIIKKGEKGNKKPFDIYEINYHEINHNGNLTIFCPSIPKAVYLYADYLHGDKEYIVVAGDGDSGLKENKYKCKNPLEAIKQHCEKLGIAYSTLSSFSSKVGVCKALWNADGIKLFTAYEA